MKIKVNKPQLDYLIYRLMDEENLKLKLDIEKRGRVTFINVNEDTADKIRDWASEELQKIGFNENYELTIEGKLLEAIIDIFYIK